jgi:hypothetical protein
MEEVMSHAVVTAIQGITILLVLGMVAFQGTVIVDQQRKLSVLRRQVLADRPPVLAESDLIGRSLPPLDGICADDLQPATWSKFLPNATGLVIVLDPIEESCWLIAEKLADTAFGSISSPYVVLMAASALDAERFLRKTGLDGRAGIVMVGPGNSTLRAMRVRWRPAAIVVLRGVVVAAAQFHDAKHLDGWARAALETGGKAPVTSV